MSRWLPLLLLAASLASCARQKAADSSPSPEPAATATPAAGDSGASGAALDPKGLEVRPADAAGVLAAVKGTGAKAVLVNMWATWCIPCRQEFPELVKLQRDYRDRGLAVLFVSADFDEAEARPFLAQHGVDWPTYIKTGDDMQFINALSPQWTGSLPATFVYDGAGNLRAFREGKASYASFEKDVRAVLDSQTKSTHQEGPS